MTVVAERRAVAPIAEQSADNALIRAATIAAGPDYHVVLDQGVLYSGHDFQKLARWNLVRTVMGDPVLNVEHIVASPQRNARLITRHLRHAVDQFVAGEEDVLHPHAHRYNAIHGTVHAAAQIAPVLFPEVRIITAGARAVSLLRRGQQAGVVPKIKLDARDEVNAHGVIEEAALIQGMLAIMNNQSDPRRPALAQTLAAIAERDLSIGVAIRRRLPVLRGQGSMIRQLAKEKRTVERAIANLERKQKKSKYGQTGVKELQTLQARYAEARPFFQLLSLAIVEANR